MNSQHAIADARSFLFVPADRPERHAKALASGADRVILDLEDAVGSPAKEDARKALADRFAAFDPPQRSRLIVRINGEGTPWFDEDLDLIARLAAQGLGALVLPKAESDVCLLAVARACPGLPLLPQIESGAGLDALDAIARAPGVVRLCLGHLDLENDLGIHSGIEQFEIAPARWDIVRASRRASLAPAIDSITADIHDTGLVRRDAERALRMGFGAKLCIHPTQIAAVHRAFMPSEQQQDWARRVLEAADTNGGAACTVDGRMVDLPVIATARRLMARVVVPD
ncbi:CoA ester lyase [Xylophilus sp. GOD-11R]|uniref:HpcH/HpaI aldolase/citrate lyase family protein n=1 Tax=Xylophilus sp. GOD-11R TaxID=3089814 RepID=UPI00298C59AA|nr:CoA ester lyase [Xylophilus sp. GOD-11R]WPB58820.1 CoA ester lyase [Xylophilus sp. GOD-11R]